MDLLASFSTLPVASSGIDFTAVRIGSRRADFLAKSAAGGPVFLLQDASAAAYWPGIELKNVSVQFQSTCRVTTADGVLEGQFAILSCDAQMPELHEVFVRCVAAAIERLPKAAGTSDLRKCMQELLDLFQALGRPGAREVVGLWAELFVISRTKDVALALEAWHTDPFERFDFSWERGCLEVKATVNEQRHHEFALEQLSAPLGGAGYIASVLLQPLSGGVGVVELAAQIETSVRTRPELRQKLWANIVTSLGSDFSDRSDRAFDTSYAERSLTLYAMDDIPAVEAPGDERISGIRFRADLSTVESSLAGSARTILDGLFA